MFMTIREEFQWEMFLVGKEFLEMPRRCLCLKTTVPNFRGTRETEMRSLKINNKLTNELGKKLNGCPLGLKTTRGFEGKVDNRILAT